MSLPSISQQVNHNDTTRGGKKKNKLSLSHNMEKDSDDDLSPVCQNIKVSPTNQQLPNTLF
jgi:hypothetical protein